MSTHKPTPLKGESGWYKIPGFEGYAANRKGELLFRKTGKITQGGVAGRYRKVSVYPDGANKPKLLYTHDLICRAFHGLPKRGQVVLHKDNDRLNLKPSNLKWGTQSENIQTMWDDDLRSSKESLVDITSLLPSKSVQSSSLDCELYHLSFNGKKNGIWEPMTPAGTEDVNQDDMEFGEPPVPRISMSPTLEQCFRAIYPNIDFYFKEKKFPHLDIYAYRPLFKGRERIVLPETLTGERWVWDAHVTGEHWVLDNVEMGMVGRYRFFNTEDGRPGLRTRPFGDRNQPNRSYVGPVNVSFVSLDTSPSLESVPPSVNW